MNEFAYGVVEKRIQRTVEALKKNAMDAYYVKTAAEVAPLAASLMPEGATVACGGSVTLAQTGVMQLLSSGRYHFLSREGLSGEALQKVFRDAFSADWYCMSSNAVTEQGELYNVDGNANRIAALAFGPKNVLIVAGYNKIVPDLDAAAARLEISLLLGLCLAVFATARFAGFVRLADTVRGDTLRLHVRAVSNTPEDQLRKLRVRDAMLAAAGEIFADAPDKPAALALARAALPRLQLTAEQAFAAAGGAAGTPVQVTLTEGWFAAAHYEAAALPPGRYDALRVELGRHAGRNWFCVLYPALCLPAAEGAEYPTGEEQALVEGGYELRFAALEWLDRLTGRDREEEKAEATAGSVPGGAPNEGESGAAGGLPDSPWRESAAAGAAPNESAEEAGTLQMEPTAAHPGR